MSPAAICSIIDRIVAETRRDIGITGKLIKIAWTADDDNLYGGEYTAYEGYLIDQALSGDEVAASNYEALARMGYV